MVGEGTGDSAVIVTVSILALLLRGFNLGLEFKGGVSLEVENVNEHWNVEDIIAYNEANDPDLPWARWIVAYEFGDVTDLFYSELDIENTPLQRIASANEVAEAAHFAEEVRRELVRLYGERGLYEGGLSVRTTLDPRLQGAAEKALRDYA